MKRALAALLTAGVIGLTGCHSSGPIFRKGVIENEQFTTFRGSNYSYPEEYEALVKTSNGEEINVFARGYDARDAWDIFVKGDTMGVVKMPGNTEYIPTRYIEDNGGIK